MCRAYILTNMPLTTDIRANRETHRWSAVLAPLIDALDRHLRRRLQVTEYSSSPDCLFRLQLIVNDEEFLLEDGTLVRAGERLVDLHFWNEHVPLIPDGRPTLAYARRIERCLDVSLSELADHLSSHDDLSDVKAIRGNMSLGASRRSEQIARIAAKYGFETLARNRPLSAGERLHRLGENILVTFLVMRRNPSAVRADTLWRGRTLTYLSRRTLERRFGA